MIPEALERIWDHQGEGFVFLSRKDKDGSWYDTAFLWPDQRSDIHNHISKHEASDLYFTPMQFSRNKRKKEYVKPTSVLYADLDPVDPRSLDYKPSIAWRSSRGRYQAAWLLDETLDISTFNQINKALSYEIGADRGGWDVTQVLRIPGTKNYKYDPPHEVKLLWNNGSPKDLPDVELLETVESTGSLLDLVRKYKIPAKWSRILQYPPRRIEPGRRSDILWALEKELVKAQVPLEDAFQMIKLSAWNKYQGRADEEVRIKAELTKVYNESTAAPRTEVQVGRFHPVRAEELLARTEVGLSWLIDQIWTSGSNGMIAGEPKTYKSTVAMDMAVSIASGVPLWESFKVNEPGPVLLIQNENSDWIMKDRLHKILHSKSLEGSTEQVRGGVNIRWPKDLPLYLVNNSGYTFSTEENRDEIEELIDSIKPRAIIFDPLYLMFEGDVNSSSELQPLLQWWMDLKNRYKTAVIVIHHWNKSGTSKRGGQRMLGSTTLHGWTESSLYLNEQTNLAGERTIFVEREFRGAGVQHHLELSISMGEVGTTDYEVKTRSALGRRNELMDLLEANPTGLSVQAIALELGISRRKVASLISEIEDQVTTHDAAKGAKLVTLR